MAVKESYAGKINRKLNKKLHVIDVAAGRVPADLVLKNAAYVNVFSNELCRGDIAVAEGLIVGMGEYHGKVEADVGGKIVLPGFIDAHIHLESSLVSPKEFAKAVLPHGTTTVITDPHEIANVMGTDGIEYMLQATEDLPVDVRFMLPSCVPATPLDESGANLDYRAIDSFYDHPRVQGLAEMMNFVGIINGDSQVVEKIVASQAHHKKIDGHAPGLTGNDLNAYIAAGVYSDHECSNVEEAMAKLERGQFIMIREGTAARNLEALAPLLCEKYIERCMFCTDDKHPNDLLEKGHIDYIVKKAISLGADPIMAVKAAGYTAARYFLLNNRGAIAPGYLADFVVIDNWENFEIEMVYKKGKLMYDGVLREFDTPEIDPIWSSGPTTPSMWPLCPPPTSPTSAPTPLSAWYPGKSCPRMPATPTTSTWSRTFSRSPSSSDIRTPTTSAWAISRATASSTAPWPPPSATTATTSSWWAPLRRTWPPPPTGLWRIAAASP